MNAIEPEIVPIELRKIRNLELDKKNAFENSCKDHEKNRQKDRIDINKIKRRRNGICQKFIPMGIN